MRWLAAAAIAVFGADQLSKLIVVHWLGLKAMRDPMYIFPPYLNFRMGWNTGINFGLFEGDEQWMRAALIAIALAVSVWLVIWAHRSFTGISSMIAAGFIVGGALANALDRVLYGAVADFLNMSCCGIKNPYAFNLADVGIFAGAILLVFTHTDDKTP